MSHCRMELFFAGHKCWSNHWLITVQYKNVLHISASHFHIRLKIINIYHWPELNEVQPDIICCCFESSMIKHNFSIAFKLLPNPTVHLILKPLKLQ